MGFARYVRSWLLIILGAALLAMSWVSTALAQDAGADAEGADGDELSTLGVIVVVAAVGLAGWLAYRRGSSGSD